MFHNVNNLQRVMVDANSGTVTIKAGATGQSIRVYAIDITLASAQTLTFKSATNAISGPFPAVTTMVRDFLYQGEFVIPRYVCAPGESLIISLGTAAAIGGVVYLTQD